eukprot:3485670-Pyramimonas_sp.AAC.1
MQIATERLVLRLHHAPIRDDLVEPVPGHAAEGVRHVLERCHPRPARLPQAPRQHLSRQQSSLPTSAGGESVILGGRAAL